MSFLSEAGAEYTAHTKLNILITFHLSVKVGNAWWASSHNTWKSFIQRATAISRKFVSVPAGWRTGSRCSTKWLGKHFNNTRKRLITHIKSRVLEPFDPISNTEFLWEYVVDLWHQRQSQRCNNLDFLYISEEIYIRLSQHEIDIQTIDLKKDIITHKDSNVDDIAISYQLSSIHECYKREYRRPWGWN